ncbi:protein B4 [Carassius carassius]|uniref:protein B4 n=1 Tax=Carassius carassius TaxID=217509 RepID=UPI002868ECE2|nr:protein B4 [Carassius carassius]
MPPKKASAEPTATVPKDSENEASETKTDSSESSSNKAAGRKVSPHPSTMEMVKEALKELDSRKGVSSQAIRGYIKERYTTVDETRLKFMVRRSLNKGIETGVFVRPANSGSTTTGAQGRFRVPSTKEAKAQSKENADPNVQKAPKPKKVKATKTKGEGASKEKSTKKKEAADDAKLKMPERDGTASKVAPAKKPKAKNAAGEGGTEPKLSKAKKASKGVEEPAAKKTGKKTAKAEEGESGDKGAETKAPGRRGKK